VKRSTLKRDVFKFLNEHPTMSAKGVCREFKEADGRVVQTYESQWRLYVKPMRWLYWFMLNKWAPVKPVTKKDKVKLRNIEKLVGVGH
ncbi:hypothetical protein LCGC14_2336860, partial [marine sediment metagenome]